MNSHRAVVRRLMERHAELLRQAGRDDGVDTELIADQDQQRFILWDIGWRGGRRVNHVYLHVRLKGGKVWVEEDWTEEGLATELARAGVPKEDIVLGFQPPERRYLSEIARGLAGGRRRGRGR